MLGRKVKLEGGRKPAKKRKWEEEDDDSGGEEPHITAAELEQWRQKEREEERREEERLRRAQEEDAARRRTEEERRETERRRKEEERRALEAAEEEAERIRRQRAEAEKGAEVVAQAPVDIPQLPGSRRAVCMSYLQFKQRGGPPCPKGEACTDRHTDDIAELQHWSRFFGERHCKFGVACRLIPHCLYRHPPGAVLEREREKLRAAAGEPLPDKRQICMVDLQFKNTGGPACPRGSACPDRHSEDSQEIYHWVKYFSERPCKFGTSCRLLPHCLYRHPQAGVVGAALDSAAPAESAPGLAAGSAIPPPGQGGKVIPPPARILEGPGQGGKVIPPPVRISEGLGAAAAVPTPPKPVCVAHLRAKVFGLPACGQGHSCPHQHPNEPADVQVWMDRFSKVTCSAGMECRMWPQCLWAHPTTAAAAPMAATDTARF